MKLWVFLFTEPTHRLQSARIAAPDKSWARGLLGAEIGEDLTVARGVLCHWAGEVDAPLGVVEKVARGSDDRCQMTDDGTNRPSSVIRHPTSGAERRP